MNTAQLREILRLLDEFDEVLEEIGFTNWLTETVWPLAVNRWIAEAGQ